MLTIKEMKKRFQDNGIHHLQEFPHRIKRHSIRKKSCVYELMVFMKKATNPPDDVNTWKQRVLSIFPDAEILETRQTTATWIDGQPPFISVVVFRLEEV